MPDHLERLIRIYNRLRRGPVTIDIISKWAKNAGIMVSERQLYRDLNRLKTLCIAEGENVVEYIDEKNRKTWKLEYSEGEEKLTQYDINSFFLLKNFAPYSVIEQRKSSIEKVEKIFYRQLSKNKFQRSIQAHELYLRRTNYYENMYGEVEHNQMEDLIWALHSKRVIVIEEEVLNAANIHLPANPFPLPMYPLELVFHRGRVRIAGLSVEKKRFLLFTIDKSLRFTLTNQSFNRKLLLADYNAGFDRLFGISASRKNKTYHIKIEFTKGYGESMMNYSLHKSQRWEQMKNGNYLLHLYCGIGRELVGFLAEGLDKVKVHQPKVLRDLFVTKLQQLAAIYNANLPIDEVTSNKDYDF